MPVCLCVGPSRGELYEHIVEAHHFQEKSAGIVMGQILSAISYVHDCSVAHRDIKPENFVFSGHGPVEGNTLKLIDFGFACHCKPGKSWVSVGPMWSKSPRENKALPSQTAGVIAPNAARGSGVGHAP